jgi:hypothetical protein
MKREKQKSEISFSLKIFLTDFDLEKYDGNFDSEKLFNLSLHSGFLYQKQNKRFN